MDRGLLKKTVYTIAVLFFLIAIILPLCYVFFSSFFGETGFTLTHYQNAFTEKNALLLLKSIIVAATIAGTSTILGGIFGFIIARTNLPFPNFFKLVLLIPLFVSPYYLAVAWRDFFFLAFDNTEMILKSEEAVMAVLTMSYTPIAMLIVSASLSNINRNIEESALLIGSGWNVFKDITLPLIKPAIISSFILTFILAISEISVPSFFVVNLIITEIFSQFSAFYNHEAAIAISAFIIIISIVLLLTERRYISDAPFLSIGSKGSKTHIIQLSSWKYLTVTAFCTLYFVAVVIVPIIVLTYQSFYQIPEYLIDRSLPGDYLPMAEGKEFTTKFFNQAYELLQPAVLDSIIYALIGAAIITTIGFVFAYIAEKENKKAINQILLLVFAIPSTVLGIALVKFFNRPSLDWIYTSMGIVLIGYIGRFTFITTRIIGNSIRQIPASLEEVAQMTGAGFFLRLRKIVLPLIAEGFFTAFIIGFIFCLSEMGTTIVIYPPGSTMLPIKIATSMHNTPESLVSAMVLIVLLITLLLLLLFFLLKMILSRKLRYGRYTT